MTRGAQVERKCKRCKEKLIEFNWKHAYYGLS